MPDDMKYNQFNDYLTIVFNAINFGNYCFHFVIEVIR